MKKIIILLSIIVIGIILLFVYKSQSLDIPSYNRVRMIQFIDEYWIENEKDIRDIDELIHSIKWERGVANTETHAHSVVLIFYRDGKKLDAEMTVTRNDECEFLLRVGNKNYFCKEDNEPLQQFIDQYVNP